MNGNKVDHILRAAGNATGQTRFVLVGSAAILAWVDTAPSEMTMTREVDLFAYDADRPERVEQVSDELDAMLGQASPFDETFGYYCDGVGPETAILPTDWESRAKEYSSPATNGVVAVVPHPNDIALAKLCAGREKDLAWLTAATRSALIDHDQMRSRFEQLPRNRGVDPQILHQRLETIRNRSRRP